MKTSHLVVLAPIPTGFLSEAIVSRKWSVSASNTAEYVDATDRGRTQKH
jgi:hypothetical protein